MTIHMTTMARVREFPPWADELDTPDDTQVIVHADGSVNCEQTGDTICFGGFASSENEQRWLEFWGF